MRKRERKRERVGREGVRRGSMERVRQSERKRERERKEGVAWRG